jgi:hypothetical protein
LQLTACSSCVDRQTTVDLRGAANQSMQRCIRVAADPRPKLFVSLVCAFGTTLAQHSLQEVMSMVLDMTAQLAPVMWGFVVLMVASVVSVLLAHNQ